ncbi:lysostaphin resistance A-like protein [Candidatus Uabimicrobium sp. HlEnr_7]|uniref:CPBP family intramembrane glutamic endopeptidase n=1 Tax=Candidatus Uabimicrobium helgolandensis TaxID=3095367 RepID=UPI0035566324
MNYEKNLKQNTSLRTVCLPTYSFITVISIWLCFHYKTHILLEQSFWEFYIIGTVPMISQITIGLIIVVITIIISIVGSSKLKWIRNAEQEIKKSIGNLTSFDIIIIAICSGIGEELLFRAAFQPTYGLVITSLFFGMLHFPVNKHFLFYPIFATIMGFILGYITLINNGCITSAIIAHIFINMINLYRINSISKNELIEKM